MNTRSKKVLQMAERLIARGAQRITDVDDHITAELAHADGYPTRTPGASEPEATGHANHKCGHCDNTGITINGPCDECGPSHSSLAERSALRHTDLERRRQDFNEAVDAWIMQGHWIDTQADQLLGTRITHERITGQRCSGTIDATCTNWVGEYPHIHPLTGETINDLCDTCWTSPKACPTCRRREAETRRGGHCEACYRKALRAKVA